MRRPLALMILVAGILLVMGAMAASASDSTMPPVDLAANTPPEGAEYVGSNTCFQCHSSNHRDWDTTYHATAMQAVASAESAIVADFSLGEETRVVDNEVYGLAEGESYSADDVTFAIGSKYRQRFAIETDDGILLLPGQWNVETATWVEFEMPENRNMMDLGCVACHGTGFDRAAQSVSEFGVACEACHGPGSVHVELTTSLPEDINPLGEEVQAARAAIVKTVDSNVCGQCHSVGQSPDGFAAPEGYVVGGHFDESMYIHAQPTGEDDDPFFWPDGSEKFPRQQWLALTESAHGNALATIQESDHGGDYCLACHSTDYIMQDNTFPEDVVTLENAQHSITCVQCHDPHGSEGVENQLRDESYDLCVSCHTGTDGGNNLIEVGGTVHHPMREMFEGVSILGLSPNPSSHFANEAYGPVCASCHMPKSARNAYFGDVGSHRFQIIMPGEAAEGQMDSCTGCHTDADPDDLTFIIESTQEDTADRLEFLRDDTNYAIEQVPDIAELAEEPTEAQQIVARINTLLSFVEADGSLGFHNPDYTNDILDEVDDLLDALYEMLDL